MGSAHQGSCDQILHIAGDSREDLIVFSNAASDVNTYLYNCIYIIYIYIYVQYIILSVQYLQ